MKKKYQEYKGLNLPNLTQEVLKTWEEKDIFKKSLESRDENKPFVFFEGPPSANGMPGIHHVMGRSIKDIFCRYKTLKGYRVNRKAGWDTHGLPIELGVEKNLGIKKEDIGKTISVTEYNDACKASVLRFTDKWNSLTEQMGYWVDMSDPYVTYENKYIESVWWLLSQIYNKDLMYKGYTIQPYSPAAGTGLSSHELGQEGSYKPVKDTTLVAQFRASNPAFFNEDEVFFMAWTTTPWTLAANTALCVNAKIDYVVVKSFNQYTGKAMNVILAKPLLTSQFNGKYQAVESQDDLAGYNFGDKKIPYFVANSYKGEELVGQSYEQLIPLVQPADGVEHAFKIIADHFVTTEDGTGIVHIAPTFGADDARVAAKYDVPGMMVDMGDDKESPIVDLQGRYIPQMGEWGGLYVKNEYYDAGQAPERSLDVEIAIHLKGLSQAFKVEKYEHNYPHCWRTHKPVIYYPLDSWFIRATRVRERMAELNDTINWKPKSTGEGRFGNWLKDASDWNLSRSRFWGIPIPIWRTEDGEEELCISSVEQLKAECDKAVTAGLMETNPLADFEVGNMTKENYDSFDLHKHFVDDITLVSASGAPMTRESDLIDVWFDSGSMPYAQQHYPFENKEAIDNNKAFPADFIAEGVDQTRGWFYTLHAIGTMCFDSVAYKNVISNGLVLDKSGQKMSKSKGNTIDPFTTLDTYGPDATRWYMVTNAQPWDNLKFDLDGITEVQRRFFGTLYNTYSFFSLYANLDGFTYAEDDVAWKDRPEIDRWILSELNTLILLVEEAYDSYEPTKAGRLIQSFVNDKMSNWYVRLCRRRFWKGEYAQDKISAYQTLYNCLLTVAQLSSPIAPFFTDRLFNDLNAITGKDQAESVHLSLFPEADKTKIDNDLEAKMQLAQKLSSLVLSLRKKEKIKVRQPLQRIMVPVLNEQIKLHLDDLRELILSEVNVKELEYLEDTSGILVKNIKPNFRTLGPKYGKFMKSIASVVAQFDQETISQIETEGKYEMVIDDENLLLDREDFEINSKDIPGWLVASQDDLTVALDIQLSEELIDEGIARELVNRIQNLRKESGLDLTDTIALKIVKDDHIIRALELRGEYIKSETLATDIVLTDDIPERGTLVEFDEVKTYIAIN